jgi:hypothetical protein
MLMSWYQTPLRLLVRACACHMLSTDGLVLLQRL